VRDSEILLELPGNDDCWYRRRPLDEADIKKVLESLPLHLAELADPRELRVEINDSIIFTEGIPTGLRRRAQQSRLPHVRLKRLRKLCGALRRALACLDDDEFKFHASPYHQLARQITERLAEINKTIEALTQKQVLRTQKGPKRHDYQRYWLVEDLADIFEAMFKRQASRHADGPWCSFLAAVLSRCEKKDMSNEGALWLWKQVRNVKHLDWSESFSEMVRTSSAPLPQEGAKPARRMPRKKRLAK
jgi:hypothetical protein